MKYNKKNVLTLEMEDLLDYNERTLDIKVDKYFFDEFEEGDSVYVHFVEDREDCIREYEMISEDEDGITMSYVCQWED